MRRRVTLVLLLAASAALAGCGSGVGHAPDLSTTPAWRSSMDAKASRALASAEASASAAGSASATAPTATTTAAPTTVASGYTISCESLGALNQSTYSSLEQVWAAGQDFFDCTATLNSYYQPTPTDQSAIALDEQQATPPGTTADPTLILEHLLGICADSSSRMPDVVTLVPQDVKAALILCPNHPQARVLQQLAAGDIVGDGTFTVGQTIKPGRWVSVPGVKDCYWERTSRSGSTLANDFVSFAPGGVPVTILPSDGGFVSQGCVAWTRSG